MIVGYISPAQFLVWVLALSMSAVLIAVVAEAIRSLWFGPRKKDDDRNFPGSLS